MTDESTVQAQAPGKAFRKGMTLVELIRKFPDDKAAEAWMASIRWPDGPECPHCGCNNVQHPTAHKTMPYRCRGNGCRRFRYVAEFAGRHNRRPMDTADMMAASVRGMVGKLLTYAKLVAG